MIREANLEDVTALAKVNLVSWQETYEGLVDSDFLDTMDLSELIVKWKNHLNDPNNKIFVDTESGLVVGYIRLEIKHEQASLGAIYLLEAYQHRGIGKALLMLGLEYFQRLGHKKVLVEVLSANPTKKFYQLFGAELYRVGTIKVGTQELSESVYAWNFQ